MRDARWGKEPGYGLRFTNTGPVEKAALDHILRDLARAGAVNRERLKPVWLTKIPLNQPRFQLLPRVLFQTGQGPCRAILLDLSRSGCLIRPTGALPPPLGEPCPLTISCRKLELTLVGIPRWSGSPEGKAIVGIAFDFKNRSEKARWRALLTACRRGHAPHRLVSSQPLSPDALLAAALHSPYRLVHFLKRKLLK